MTGRSRSLVLGALLGLAVVACAGPAAAPTKTYPPPSAATNLDVTPAVGLGELRRRGDVGPRDHEDVRRGARRDVPECDDLVVVVDAIGRDLPGDDPAEQAVRHGLSPFAHHRTGFELIRNPMVPTRPAMRYEMYRCRLARSFQTSSSAAAVTPTSRRRFGRCTKKAIARFVK